MHRGIENPDSFILLVRWDSVEDHMIGFRESPRLHRMARAAGAAFRRPPADGALRGAALSDWAKRMSAVSGLRA